MSIPPRVRLLGLVSLWACSRRDPSAPGGAGSPATVEVAAVGASSAAPTPQPSASPPAASGSAGPGVARQEGALLERLHAAGDRHDCDAEVATIRRELARDTSTSDVELERFRQRRDTRGKGDMPHPTEGGACAIFGIQRAIEGAIEDRRRAR